MRGILRKNGYNYSEIISKWNFLVGKNIANSCFPKSIKMSQENKNGTLILSVQRGDEINVEYSNNSKSKGLKYSKIYNIKCIGLRYFNVFGPGQYGDSPYATAVSAWCHAIKNNLSLRFYSRIHIPYEDDVGTMKLNLLKAT